MNVRALPTPIKLSIMLALLCGASCAETPKAEPAPIYLIDEPDQAPTTPDMASSLTDSSDDADQAPSALPLPPSCQERGLEATPFQAGGGSTWDGLAGDFTVQTQRGPWTLSKQWSGCDSYVVLSYAASDYGEALWRSLSARLLTSSAPHVHYLFGVYGDQATVEAKLKQLQEAMTSVIGNLEPAQRRQWLDRLHYITEPIQNTQGSLGALMRAAAQPAYVVGVDLEQRYDQGGALMAIGASGFVPDITMAAYLSRFYQYRATLAKRLEAERDKVTVVDVINQRVTENNKLYTATFPDAQTMQRFDTMEIEVEASCGPDPRQDCGEWDYEAYLERCRLDVASDPDCAQRDQLLLWITPYARPGTRRWVVDATPFLAMLKGGGEQTFRFGMLWNMNPNQVRVSFRLSDRGVGLKPHAIVPLFEGGEFNATYNEGRSPVAFTRDAADKKVELVTLLSGHGQTEGNNCAEWCDHEHTFSFGEGKQPVKISYPGQAGVAMGCAQRVDEGVVPGQWGNWTPGRAAWCPGLPVPLKRHDVSDRLAAAQEAQLSYAGSYKGQAPAGGRIRLSSYLVTYR